MPNYLTIDCETSIGPNKDGNPFTKSNKLCVVGLLSGDGNYRHFDIEWSDEPYGQSLVEINEAIEGCDLLIGHNIKFDLHWLRRYLPSIKFPRVYDTQLAEFILSNQTWVMPSLEDVAQKRLGEGKYDVVKNEYWANNIDTPDIPKDILFPYCEQDIRLTYQIFEQQRQELTPKQRTLAALQFEDLLILEEMEFNGLLYNFGEAQNEGVKAQAAIKKIDEELYRLVPFDWLNWGSPDHVSCILYGGEIYVPCIETVVRILKDGRQKEYQRKGVRPETFPRLVQPLKGTEGEDTIHYATDSELAAHNRVRASAGKRPLVRHWSISEPVIRKLRATGKARQIIQCLLERARLSQLDELYFTGLLNKTAITEWGPDMIHGQFNQAVARTSRLSSSGPNLQNFSREIKHLFYSRYATS